MNNPSYSLSVAASSEISLRITICGSNNEFEQIILNPSKVYVIDEEQNFVFNPDFAKLVKEISIKPKTSKTVQIFHFSFKPTK